MRRKGRGGCECRLWQGYTALHLASRYGYPDIVALLLSKARDAAGKGGGGALLWAHPGPTKQHEQ